MRLRPWLLASIGLNLILAAAWYIADLQEESFAPVPTRRLDLDARKVRTNSVVRRITFTWADLAATNLPAYITNLRNKGCPEGVIRDIILADVNKGYARRRATEVVTPDQQWWRSSPDPAVAGAANAQFRDLETGRRAELTDLLGTNWVTVTDQLAWVISNYGLTGPELGDLPAVIKQAVFDIAGRTTEELRGMDAMEAARIRSAERLALGAVLPEAALREYLLRYSQNAARLRELTRGVTLSPEQFAGLFDAADPIASLPEFYYQGTDAQMQQRQRDLQTRYDAALRQWIGDEAFAALQMSLDPLYVAAREAAQQSGAPDKAIGPLYQINRATQTELNRIRADPALGNEERIKALEETRVEEQKAIELLLGPTVFQRWLQTQVRP